MEHKPNPKKLKPSEILAIKNPLFVAYRANPEFANLTDDELNQMADIAARRWLEYPAINCHSTPECEQAWHDKTFNSGTLKEVK